MSGALEKDDENDDELLMALHPEKHEMPLWNLLKSFSKPTVITLDRTISAESDSVQYVEYSGPIARKRVRSRSPLAYVRDVTSSKYAEFRSKAIANDNELKASIFMSALQNPEEPFGNQSTKAILPVDITALEEKISTYVADTIKSAELSKQVKNFFRASRTFTNRQSAANNHNLAVELVAAQYRQIESLAKAFNSFEKKNAFAFMPLREYLLAVNRFFNDSNKELFFDESTGQLMFSAKHGPKKERVPQSVTRLSSGERQILILFTFFAFASDPKSVFIVDEPELSLHPKWQSDFMNAFLKLKRVQTQLILATHSPDIVGNYKNNCVVVRGNRS